MIYLFLRKIIGNIKKTWWYLLKTANECDIASDGDIDDTYDWVDIFFVDFDDASLFQEHMIELIRRHNLWNHISIIVHLW